MGKTEFRRVPVPINRRTPLQQNWEKIFTPVVEHLKLQIRYNLRTKHVELRVSITKSAVRRRLCNNLHYLVMYHSTRYTRAHNKKHSVLIYYLCLCLSGFIFQIVWPVPLIHNSNTKNCFISSNSIIVYSFCSIHVYYSRLSKISHIDFIICPFQTSPETKNASALQKGADFVKAFTLGFEANVSFLKAARHLGLTSSLTGTVVFENVCMHASEINIL